MEKQMSVLGVGHKAGAAVGAYLAVTIAISYLFAPSFRITEAYAALLRAGVALIIAGFSLNLVAALQMLAAHKRDRLVTTGMYHLFLHPMYFFMLFITLPGVALLFNSYLVLTVVPVSILVVRRLVREENEYLERRYGNAYREYRKTVMIPF